jgi:hypothetical protein
MVSNPGFIDLDHSPGPSASRFSSLIGCSFILVLHRALPDLQRMKLLLLCGRVVGTEVGILFGAIKPGF